MSPIWDADTEQQLLLSAQLYPNDWATIKADLSEISDQTFTDSQLAQKVQELEAAKAHGSSSDKQQSPPKSKRKYGKQSARGRPHSQDKQAARGRQTSSELSDVGEEEEDELDSQDDTPQLPRLRAAPLTDAEAPSSDEEIANVSTKKLKQQVKQSARKKRRTELFNTTKLLKLELAHRKKESEAANDQLDDVKRGWLKA